MPRPAFIQVEEATDAASGLPLDRSRLPGSGLVLTLPESPPTQPTQGPPTPSRLPTLRPGRSVTWDMSDSGARQKRLSLGVVDKERLSVELVEDHSLPAMGFGVRLYVCEDEEEPVYPTPLPTLEELGPRSRPRRSLQDVISRVMCRASFVAEFPSHFANQAGSIATTAIVHRPANDADITELIGLAQRAAPQMSVRVVGGGYSSSPCVTSAAEAPRALVLSLRSYASNLHPSMQIDRATGMIWVNAGWTLAKLYERVHLQVPSLFLPTQMSGPALTVGGVVCGCEGGSFDYGLLSDAVVALRVICADGEPRVVSDEADLKFWRVSFGLLGVVTHVEFQLRRLRFKAKHTPPLASEEPALAALRELGLGADAQLARYYYSPYTGRLLCLAWSAASTEPKDEEDASWHSQTPALQLLPPPSPKPSQRGAKFGQNGEDQSELEYVVGAPRIHCCMAITGPGAASYFLEQKRWTRHGAADACDIVLRELARSSADALVTDHDFLFLEQRRHTVQLAYFIPVDTELRNVLKALRVVTDVAQRLAKEDAPYKLELPVSWRFVRGTDRALLSPVHSPGFPQPSPDAPLYMAIELATLAGGALDSTLEAQGTPLMHAFVGALAAVESGWRALQGKPDLGKYFGVEPTAGGVYRPFDEDVARSAVAPERRALFRGKMRELDPEGIFGSREWADRLLGADESADAPLVPGGPA